MTSAEGLLSRRNAPVVVAAVALVTLGAFENRAISTALPTMLTELDAVTSYGLVGAAPLATYLVSVAGAGWWADRRGPATVLRMGAATFVAGMVATGAATSLPLLIVGRLLAGFAEGLLDVGLMVLVATVLEPQLRPKIVATFAAAWVLPSVAGPVLTGFVTAWVGWRWIFAAGPLVLGLAWLALRPALGLAQAQRPHTASATHGLEEREGDGSVGSVIPVIRWAGVAAAALVALSLATEELQATGATALGGTAGAVALSLGTLGVLRASARRILPPGALRAACGIGGVVALRGLLSAAFVGVGAFLPLVLTVLRHHGPVSAGISLSITGVTWTMGSMLQGRWPGRPLVLLRAGFGLVTMGLAATSLIVWLDAPTAVGLAGWALAGIGIGVTSGTLSVLTMSASNESNQGRNNAGGQMAASIGSAVFLAVAGGVLALFGEPSRAAFGVISALAVGVALTGLLATRRARCAVPDPPAAVRAGT
ncbi:MAG TPA: MFS transporter [Dermatophilaceae bacterium]|nr:MFS transporter [Dermatophilaceae bacterium]